MKSLFSLAVLIALSGCGVETASTAATAGEIKRREMEQGKKTMTQAQQKIHQGMSEMQRRPEDLDKQQ